MNFRQFLEVRLKGPARGRSKRRGPYWGDSGAGILLIAADTGKLLVNERGARVDGGRSYGIYGGGFWLDDGEDFDDVNPLQVALHELAEEAGIRVNPSRTELLYDFYDPRHDWHYYSYVGVVPQEMPTNSATRAAWEEGGRSGWFTYQEMMALSPKHPGFAKMLQHASGKILRIVNSLGPRNEV